MSKSNTKLAPALPTSNLASIRQKLADAQKAADDLKTLEAAELAKHSEGILAKIKAFPADLSAILGFEVTPAHAAKMLIAGKIISPEDIVTRQNLTEEQVAALKLRCETRQKAIDAGADDPDPISKIAADFGITEVTVNTRRKSWGLTRKKGAVAA